MTPSRPEAPMHYDPQLPILVELEDHIRGLALAAEAAAVGGATTAGGMATGGATAESAAPPAVGTRPRRARPRTGRPDRGRTSPAARGATGRLLRRGAVLALLGCTVGATATALDRASDRARDASPGVVASGSVGGASWRLEVTRSEGRLCPALVVAGSSTPGAALSTDCVAAPTGTEVVSTTTLAAERAVVGGLAGPDVRAVRVTVGPRRRTVRTRALTPDEPNGPRAFGVVLRRPRGEVDVVPRVRPLDGRRRSAGPVVRDCSAAPRAASCGR
jgi:hypothetical protein